MAHVLLMQDFLQFPDTTMVSKVGKFIGDLKHEAIIDLGKDM